MSWNAEGFCGGLEAAIRAAAMSAANAGRAAAAEQDGWTALSRLANALRSERRRTARLERELAAALLRAESAERTLTLLRRR